MKADFVSGFANRLVKFLERKHLSGNLYNGAVSDFRIFDRMCAECFPNETKFTA